jgi:hypothetical protein
MIEKKTIWAVNRSLGIIEKTAIVEDGKVLAAKNVNSDDVDFGGYEYNILRYFVTKEEANEWIEQEKKFIIKMVPKVKKFIERMDSLYDCRKKLGIEKSDYLGHYAEDNAEDRYKNVRKWYNDECDYANKLETFIKSRMLNIDGRMIPIDQVREVQWYGLDGAEETEPEQWKAALVTKNGGEITTCTVEDVRLIWATIGKCIGSWFIDNEIDYEKEDEDKK